MNTIGTIDCDLYGDNFSELYFAIKELHKEVYLPNEKIVIISTYDYYKQSHGLLLESIQKIVNNVDISNCFILFKTTNSNVIEEYTYVLDNFSHDPTPFEIEIIDAFKANYESITAEDLDKRKDRLTLIDIRTMKERNNTGVIKGSIGISAFDIKGNFNPNFINSYKAVATKDDHVVFISNEGVVSAILANGFVEKLGLNNIYTLVGGVQYWIKDKRDLIK